MKAIHCKTQNEFNKVLDIFEKKGWTWSSGEKPLELKDQFLFNSETTVIDYHDRMEYAFLEHYIRNEPLYTIISFGEFLLEEEKEMIDLKSLDEAIASVHECMEGRTELTGTDLYNIHYFLNEYRNLKSKESKENMESEDNQEMVN